MRAVYFRFCFIVARFSTFSYAFNSYPDEYYGPTLFPGNMSTGSHRGLKKKPLNIWRNVFYTCCF